MNIPGQENSRLELSHTNLGIYAVNQGYMWSSNIRKLGVSSNRADADVVPPENESSHKIPNEGRTR